MFHAPICQLASLVGDNVGSSEGCMLGYLVGSGVAQASVAGHRLFSVGLVAVHKWSDKVTCIAPSARTHCTLLTCSSAGFPQAVGHFLGLQLNVFITVQSSP